MNAALYARVSTKAGSQNPDMQVRELRDYCQRRGWQIMGEYVDVGITGAREQRPEQRSQGAMRERRSAV